MVKDIFKLFGIKREMIFNKKNFLKGFLFLVIGIFLIQFGSAAVGHGAPAITPGEFTIGNYTFPDSLFVNGSLGIGTDSPSHKFQVVEGADGLTIGSTTGEIAILGYDGSDYNAIDIRAQGTTGSQLFLNTDGNVGIGTTEPGAKLEISKEMSDFSTSFTFPHLRLGSTNVADNTGFVGVTYATSSANNYGWSSGALRSNSGQGDFVWKFHSNSATGNERMRITSTGNVGIGTTTPGQKLSVVGNVNASGMCLGEVCISSWDDINASASATNYWTKTGTNLSYTEGNVGIGTDSPSAKLQTNGSIYVGVSNSGSLELVPYIALETAEDLSFMGGTYDWGLINSYEYLGDTGGIIINYASNSSLGNEFYKDFVVADGKHNEILVVDGSAGNVGIGTTSPNLGRLQIKAETANESGGITFYQDSGSTARMYLESDGNSDFNWHLTRGGFDDRGIIIDSSGNVGIGTTTPSAKLDINGSLKFEGGNQDFFIGGVDETDDSSGYTSGINYGGIKIDGNSGTNRQMFLFTDGGNTGNIFSVLSSADEGTTWNHNFVIQQDGNVGIGTTSPGQKLSVAGNVNASGMCLGEVCISSWDDINASASATNYWTKTGTNLSYTEGNVGIGTDSPSYKLSIIDNNFSEDAPKLFVGRQEGEGIYFSTTDTTSYITSIQDEDSSEYGNLILRVDDRGSREGFFSVQTIGDTSLLKILNNGNVGIGTTSPGQKLSVAGNVNASGMCLGEVCISSWDDINASASATNYWTKTGTNLSYSDGNVGIGTTSPSYKLDVMGGSLGISDGGDTDLVLAGRVSSRPTVAEASSTITTSASGGSYPYDRYGNLILTSRNSDSNDIVFQTGASSTNRMVIGGDGNVGIGTDSPDVTLDIYQSSDDNGIIVRGYDDRNSSWIKLNLDATGIAALDSSSGFRFRQAGANIAYIQESSDNGFRLYDDIALSFGTTASGRYSMGYDSNNWDFRISQNGAFTTDSLVKFIIQNNSGNVGIGTTTPGQKLSVAGNVNASGMCLGEVCISSWDDINASASATNYWTKDGSDVYYNDGNVGIGTDSPIELLQVGSANYGGNASIRINANGGGYYASLKFIGGGAGIWSWTLDDDADEIYLEDDGVKRIFVSSSGNVGIGTTSPSSKLTVDGSINATGDICIKGGNCLSNMGDSIWSYNQTTGTYNLYGENWYNHTLATYNLYNGAWSSTYNSTYAIWAYNQTAASGSVGGTGSEGYIPQWQSGSVLNNSVIYQQGGNVGIGTTSPTSKLTINGSGALLNVINDSDTLFIVNETSGNVGIGTDSPSEALDVNGDIILSANYASLYLGGTALRIREYIDGTALGFYVNSEANPTSIINDEYAFDAKLGGDPIRVANNVGFIARNAADSNNINLIYADTSNNVRVGNTGEMTIDGNVGIGTTSPGQKLSVAGNVNASGMCLGEVCISSWDDINASASATNYWTKTGTNLSYTEGNVGIGTDSPQQELDVNGTLVVGNTDTGVFIREVSGIGEVVGIDTDARTFNDLKLRAGNYDQLYLKTNGNVGIGTTSPGQKLSVAGNVNASGMCLGEVCISSWDDINASASATNYWTKDGSDVYYNDGNVGIGTTSPSEKLEVQTSTNSSNIVKFNNAAGIGVFTVYSDADGDGIMYLRDKDNDVNVRIYSNGDTYFNGGNVGIGTTTPGEKLSVAGNVNASGMCLGEVCISSWDDINASASATNYWTKTGTNLSYSDGAIGLGVLNPSARFEINNTGFSQTSLKLASGNSDQDFYIGAGEGYGFYWRYKGTHSANDNDLELWAQGQTGTDVQVYNIKQDGNISFVPAGGGRVGIGTDSPTATLEVSDSSKGLTIDPTADSPTINTTGSTNVTITSSGGSVIIKLG